jgi:hypothetical protein
MLLSVVCIVVLVGLGGARNSEALASQYHSISNYNWRPSTPVAIHTPLKAPSNTTLLLENGEIDHVPSALKKSTPSFHLLMPAETDSNNFCKTTLSAMLLNYPPPTAINFHETFATPADRERQTLASIHDYLNNAKMVHDDDLVLIVDGQETWFQLPSDVMVKQYEQVLEQANGRLLRKYGKTNEGLQKFNQTIVFGAEICGGKDAACKDAPRSILPQDTHGAKVSGKSEDMPARHINPKVAMGPAKDLRVLYEAALRIFEKQNSENQTLRTVFATILSEQQSRRDATKKSQPAAAALQAWISKLRTEKHATEKHATARRIPSAKVTLRKEKKYEYALGLDYTHTLFQPSPHPKTHELTHLHANSTARLPASLESSKPPFWSPDPYQHNPSPNEHPAYINALTYTSQIDTLPDRHTNWSAVPLVANTRTGAIPAALASSAVAWEALWYAPHARALLRAALRAPQSPDGYHNSAVGGDRSWDVRGGRGGVWTAPEALWMQWGEIDGVCGNVGQMRAVFEDEKGVWLHETEADGEVQRERDMLEYWKKVAEKERKDDEKARRWVA